MGVSGIHGLGLRVSIYGCSPTIRGTLSGTPILRIVRLILVVYIGIFLFRESTIFPYLKVDNSSDYVAVSENNSAISILLKAREVRDT